MRIRTLLKPMLVFVLTILGALEAHPGWAGSAAPIPTLDGVGLVTLGGAVAMAGAWLVARKRNRD